MECTRGIRYRTEAKAERALKHRADCRADPGWEYRPQECPDCKGWHLVQVYIPATRGTPIEAIPQMCASKKAYPTEKIANAARAAAEVRRGQPLRVYQCPSCLRWHLTRASERWWEKAG